MKSLSKLVAAAALLLAPAAVPAAQPGDGKPPVDMQAIERMLGGHSQIEGDELQRRVAAAAAHPLGSERNPVRAAMPPGQRAYLSRLRCADGVAPRFRRIGNFGLGVYGNIVDGYQLSCAGGVPADQIVYMDMYHAGHVEERPVPGFTIAAPPARPGSTT